MDQRSQIRKRLIGFGCIAATSALLMDCGSLPGVPGAGKLPGGCNVDIHNPSAIMSGSFGLKAEVEGRLKAALSAGAGLEQLSLKLEADVATVCGDLAKDLGATDAELAPKEAGPGKKAEAACNAAVAHLATVKATVKGKVKIDAKPPTCSVSMDASAKCSGECDATIEPGSVKVECEGSISGTCEAECKGECHLEAGAECSGTCGGTCEGTCKGEFKGECKGKCKGKCDGKKSSAACAGTCEGKCEGAEVKGSCSGSCGGSCTGSCEVKAGGSCTGTCSGGCSVEYKEPKCDGEMKAPEVSAECKADCDVKMQSELQCTPAQVEVSIAGSADVEGAAKLEAALKAHLPKLLKLVASTEGRTERAIANVQASLDGVQAVIKGGGDAKAVMASGACIAGALKAQVDASISLKVSVSASASASGKASASS